MPPAATTATDRDTNDALSTADAVPAATQSGQPLDTLAQEGRVRWVTSKRDFRARAHSNPLNDGLFNPPADASMLNMKALYVNPPVPYVQWCDVGCGYGGLLACLSVAYADKVMLGLEIRDRVASFCQQRVKEMRRLYAGSYGNLAFDRTNVMKYLPNYFARGSLEKLFFCYPDPHFKRKKNRQRVVSALMLDEYAFVMAEGVGVAYVVTDVEELFQWMVERFEGHALFERREESVHTADAVARFVRDMTDEAQRVEKGGRRKWEASFLRVRNPEWDTS